MDLINKIIKIYNEEGNAYLDDKPNFTKISCLYSLYHYYNDDLTRLDEINDNQLFIKGKYVTLSLITIGVDASSDTIDFVFFVNENISLTNFKNEILNECGEITANIICRNKNNLNEKAIENYLSIVNDVVNPSYMIKVFYTFNDNNFDRYEIMQEFASHKVKSDKINFSLLFLEDINTEIEDVENPKDNVPNGIIDMFENNGICSFGNEKSFICLISAKSLKFNFIQYGTHGLLASNLRYFVSNKKIDAKIVNTIENDGNNFVYFNNGIIITCDNYRIENNKIYLTNFSIVNGGQTTNLIGCTPFENDFGVVCKVIKNKYSSTEQKVDFLSKVAEASNTQKPINIKDLIANKKEQRLLKLQFAKEGIFLKIKRGEKIDLQYYKEKWQNASNDEIAQLIYSTVYQSPGAAKNSKSKLLENEQSYNLIFNEKYNSRFFVLLQRLKVCYAYFQKYILKNEKDSIEKVGLVKHANYFTFAIISFIYKYFINNKLQQYIDELNPNSVNNLNTTLKNFLIYNDIGKTNYLKEGIDNLITNGFFNKLFNKIFDDILIISYKKFKENYYSYSYGQFFKSDLYYYNFVIPEICANLKSASFKNDYRNLFDVYFEMTSVDVDYSFNDKTNYITNNGNLNDDLLNFRKIKYQELKGKCKAYEIFTNVQLSHIVYYLPKSKLDLRILCKLSKSQIDRFGDDILTIVKFYSSVDKLI